MIFKPLSNSSNKIGVVLITLVVFWSNFLFAQSNLVPNPSFEEKGCCPDKPNLNEGKTGPLSIPCLDTWRMPDRKALCRVGTPDYFNTCDYDKLSIGPRTGFGYTGVHQTFGTISSHDYREYITVQLTSALIKNHVYFVEFFVTNDSENDQIGSIGAYFSMDRPKVCHKSFLKGKPNPHIENTSLVDHNNGWIPISGTFKANKNYEWITIGNFRDDNDFIHGAVTSFSIGKVSQAYGPIGVGSDSVDVDWKILKLTNKEMKLQTLYIDGKVYELTFSKT